MMRVIEQQRERRKADNEDDLKRREPRLRAARTPAAAAVREGQNRDQTGGQPDRRELRKHRREIAAKGHGRQRGGRRETDGEGYPPGDKAGDGMVNRREEVVLAAGARQRRAEFRIGQCAAERGDTAHGPQGEQHGRGADLYKLKSQAGKNAGANHVSDDDGGGNGRRKTSHAPLFPVLTARIKRSRWVYLFLTALAVGLHKLRARVPPRPPALLVANEQTALFAPGLTQFGA